MALLTGGTSATTSLNAMVFNPAMSVADASAFEALVKGDINPAHPSWPGAFEATGGLLYIPNRGVLRPRPGDYVMVDTATGWPILLSARAIAAGPWTHS